MLRFLTDENFNGAITRGLFRLNPAIDLLTVYDAELATKSDPEVLEWAAVNQRLLITHDVRTMRPFAQRRVASGLAMPGVVEVPTICLIRHVIEDILILNECSDEGDWEGQIIRIPL